MFSKRSILSLIAVLAVAVIAALLWRADAVCHVPRHREALKIGSAAGCMEFWLHRYQSAWAGMLGAGAALLAAWTAWQAVQRQVDAQTRAHQLNELAFWQKKADASEVAFNGIDILSTISGPICFAIRNAEAEDEDYHYVDQLRAVQATGRLDVANFPATGPEMSAWRLNVHITSLRTLYQALQRNNFMGTDEGAAEFEAAANAIEEIDRELPQLRALRHMDFERARKALSQFEE